MKEKYLNYSWLPVVNFESGGKSYYEKFLKNASWPGGASGITVGIGADLGYMSLAEFRKNFSPFFDQRSNEKLLSVIGLKGALAKSKLLNVEGVELDWDNAMEIFNNWTLPKFWNLTNFIWPGLENLCENAQVALVSIVFNRGASTKGSSRAEMRNIKQFVLRADYKNIAEQIRSMKRLWVGKNLDGLIRRREIEAVMVESCLGL